MPDQRAFNNAPVATAIASAQVVCEGLRQGLLLHRQVNEDIVPDTLGFRKRIGIVVPSTNTTVQPECEPLRPRGVTNHTGRVTIKERPLTTEQAFFEHMHDMREGIGTAIDQIMTAGLDHLIIGVALETFWGGVAAADKLQGELASRAGVGVSMGSTAWSRRSRRSAPGASPYSRRISRAATRSAPRPAGGRPRGGAAQGIETRNARAIAQVR